MIPPTDPHKQPPSSLTATTGTICVCPHCGHRHHGYNQQASTVLDCLTLATDALHEARRLVEDEVLP